jgi:hypothetical protein
MSEVTRVACLKLVPPVRKYFHLKLSKAYLTEDQNSSNAIMRGLKNEMS